MDAPAAIRATYSDMRFVKGRKVVQILLEAPIEEAPNVVALLGTPNPASEIWVAVARLGNPVSVPEQAPPKEKRRFSELPPAQQAALKCQDESFQRFIRERVPEWPVMGEDGVAEVVRRVCGVKSRSELNNSPDAAESWRILLGEYSEWSKQPAF